MKFAHGVIVRPAKLPDPSEITAVPHPDDSVEIWTDEPDDFDLPQMMGEPEPLV